LILYIDGTAPAALMLRYYHGSPELVVVGSGCSRLVETNSFIVQDIKVIILP
jgi:hypothetical protein